MPDDHSHPLLRQTPLTVNPFIDLPKAPTLPPNYATLPSTLPPSILNTAASSSSASDVPAYVTTNSSGYAAHPSAIIAQNQNLLEQIKKREEEGRKQVEEWERGIQERELQERRRVAPGWLDREERILEPERKQTSSMNNGQRNLMDEPEMSEIAAEGRKESQADDLGAAMDRQFGRSEMGS